MRILEDSITYYTEENLLGNLGYNMKTIKLKLLRV